MEKAQLDVDNYYEVAIRVAKAAGKVAQEAYCRDKVVTSKESNADLVTETDKKVEQLIMSDLKREFPHHVFIGEESVFDGFDCTLSAKPTWMVDPIDGTMNFIHRLPLSAVSIGLWVDRKPLVGVVYNYATDEMYAAARGKGAMLNGRQINVSGCTKLTDALVITEAGCNRSEHLVKPKLETWSKLIMGSEPIRGFRCFGSAALNLCMVASGSADVYYEYGVHCWDIAAGVLIVEEAGGVVLDPKGMEIQNGPTYILDGGELDVMKRGVLASSSLQLAMRIAEKVVEVVDHYPPDGQ